MAERLTNNNLPTRTDLSTFINQHQSKAEFSSVNAKSISVSGDLSHGHTSEASAGRGAFVSLFGMLMALINFYNVSRVQANTS